MNVLLSSVGRRGYLVDYFRDAIAPEGKVIATNCLAKTAGMEAADFAYVVPDAGSEDFVDALLDVCKKYSVKLLFSLHDWEAPFIANAASRFKEAGVVLGISSPQVLRICLDKYETYRFCLDHGLDTPRTYLSEGDAVDACMRGEITFPLIVKARFGQGSLALHVAHTQEDLSAACVLAINQIGRFADNNLHPIGESPIIIQEMVEGPEYGLDVVNDFTGEFRACLCKQKMGMRAGETDMALTVHDPLLFNLGAATSAALRHIGMLDADVIVSNGKPYIIEMNPRFGGHYPFSHIAGANVPAALVAWAKNEPENPDWLEIQAGVCAFKNLMVTRFAKPPMDYECQDVG